MKKISLKELDKKLEELNTNLEELNKELDNLFPNETISEDSKNKELLVKFLRENFDLTAFDINWKTDWFVELTDVTGDRISLMCFNPYEIWTSINEKPHLSYRLKNDEFVVVN